MRFWDLFFVGFVFRFSPIWWPCKLVGWPVEWMWHSSMVMVSSVGNIIWNCLKVFNISFKFYSWARRAGGVSCSGMRLTSTYWPGRNIGDVTWPFKSALVLNLSIFQCLVGMCLRCPEFSQKVLTNWAGFGWCWQIGWYWRRWIRHAGPDRCRDHTGLNDVISVERFNYALWTYVSSWTNLSQSVWFSATKRWSWVRIVLLNCSPWPLFWE